jgi:hypothetical protein
LSSVGTQAKFALASALNDHIRDLRPVDHDINDRADLKIYLPKPGFKLETAAVYFELRKSGRHDPVQNGPAQSREKVSGAAGTR